MCHPCRQRKPHRESNSFIVRSVGPSCPPKQPASQSVAHSATGSYRALPNATVGSHFSHPVMAPVRFRPGAPPCSCCAQLHQRSLPSEIGGFGCMLFLMNWCQGEPKSGHTNRCEERKPYRGSNSLIVRPVGPNCPDYDSVRVLRLHAPLLWAGESRKP